MTRDPRYDPNDPAYDPAYAPNDPAYAPNAADDTRVVERQTYVERERPVVADPGYVPPAAQPAGSQVNVNADAGRPTYVEPVEPGPLYWARRVLSLLFGILAKESNGRVHAVSRAGAAGPLQFMPATGARLGLGWREGFDTRYDPQLAARASVLYFNERFAELGDDLAFAVAAYNGGEGRALRLKRAAGDKSFWDPSVQAQLPPETRDYVPYVLAAAWLFLHPEEYGLEFPKVDGAATVIKLEAPASIYQLAICLGGPREGFFRALRNLNPRYEPHVAITAGTELRVPVAVPPLYREHCVSGPRAQQAIALMAASKPTVPATATRGPDRGYRVKSGDTLSSISRRHGCGGA